MSEKLRKKVVIVVFIGAVIYGGLNFFPSKKKAVSPVAEQPTVATQITKVDDLNLRKEALVNSSVNVEKDCKKAWGHDPFINYAKPNSPAVKHTENKLWQLSGIIYNNHAPSAIINKKSVSVGDVIDDATVKEINQKDVKIELNGKEITLTVNKG